MPSPCCQWGQRAEDGLKKIENMPRRAGKYEEYPEFSKINTTVTSAERIEVAAKERGQRTFR